MKVLFVCSQNRLRSATAEVVFSAYPNLEVLSCGTAADAVTPLSADLVHWAEVIFAMENHHRDKIRERYGKLLDGKRLIVLRIPDNYDTWILTWSSFSKGKCPHSSNEQIEEGHRVVMEFPITRLCRRDATTNRIAEGPAKWSSLSQRLISRFLVWVYPFWRGRTRGICPAHKPRRSLASSGR